MKIAIQKALKKAALFVLALLLAGIIFEQSAQLYFNSKKPDESAFCNINGKNIHFVKKGTGGPTVVFQSGLGGDYKIWEEIQDTISKQATTISYDRLGLLWSDDSDETRTLDSMTDELQQLLEKTNCPKPYILIGHSLAGITLRPFIRDHAADVQAVIFLDVSHPLQVKKSSEELRKYLVVPPKWLIATLVETGLAHSFFYFKPFISDVPASHWLNRHITNYFYKMYKVLLREAADDDAMFEAADKISTFGSTPLTVITGAYLAGADFLGSISLQKEYLDIHRSGQRDLLNLSTESRQIIAPRSGHYVQLQDPDVVIKSIRDAMVSK